jgi:hypothetical protein
VAGGAVAAGDVKGSGAGGVADGDLHDADGGRGARLGFNGALQQSCQPDVRFDGDDAADRACTLRGCDGEETDVGADVPDDVAGIYVLTSKVEEVGLKTQVPVFETCIGRDVDGGGVEIFGEMSQQDAVTAHLFYNSSEKSHCEWSLVLSLHDVQVMHQLQGI